MFRKILVLPGDGIGPEITAEAINDLVDAYIRDGVWVLSRDYMVDFLKNRYGTLIQAARQLGQPDADTLLKDFGRVQSRLYLSARIA